MKTIFYRRPSEKISRGEIEKSWEEFDNFLHNIKLDTFKSNSTERIVLKSPEKIEAPRILANFFNMTYNDEKYKMIYATVKNLNSEMLRKFEDIQNPNMSCEDKSRNYHLLKKLLIYLD